jgi:RNA polymerase sigma factor (sigma-70 family)
MLGSGAPDERPDGKLLERYVEERDEAAFAALVQRYGSLVLGVCQRVLQDPHEAEDAFQATFLVLVRKASSLDRRGSLGNWIYAVAYRTAVKAKANAARRRMRERQALPMPSEQPIDAALWKELRPVLDEEINRLPEKYRAPLVLCYLEGKTNEQAANELGWPTGSMSRRLAQGREMLRKRLVGRGFTVSGILLGTLLTSGDASAAVPTTLAFSTVKAAMVFKAKSAVTGTALSPTVAALAEETLRAMVVPKLKAVAAVLLWFLPLGVIGTGAAVTWEMVPGIQGPQRGPHHWATVYQSSWNLEFEIRERSTPILSLATGPDGVTIASGSMAPDASVQLLDLATRITRRTLRGHTDSVTALAFAPYGVHLLASGSRDKTVRLWDLASPDGHSDILRGHGQEVTAVAFSRTGKLLASASLDRTIRIWDAAARKLQRTMTGGSPVHAIAFSADGRTLASGNQDGTFTLWNVASGNVEASVKGHAEKVSGICFSPQGQLLATASADATVKLWQLAPQPRLKAALRGHKAPVTCLAFNPNGTFLASGSSDESIRIWHVAGAQEWTALTGTQGSINTLTWSHDPVRLIAGGSDCSLGVYEEVRVLLGAPRNH